MHCDSPQDAQNVQVESMSPVHRRSELFRLIAATRSALATNRKRRQLAATEFRRDLRSHRATIRTVLMMIRRGWRASPDSKSRDSGTPQQAARGAGDSLGMLNEWPQLPELPDNDCDLPEEKRLLRAIQRHPEGVSILEIGNEIGVDFRRLLGSADMLLASGQIDQVHELFYPAGK